MHIFGSTRQELPFSAERIRNSRSTRHRGFEIRRFKCEVGGFEAAVDPGFHHLDVSKLFAGMIIDDLSGEFNSLDRLPAMQFIGACHG